MALQWLSLNLPITTVLRHLCNSSWITSQAFATTVIRPVAARSRGLPFSNERRFAWGTGMRLSNLTYHQPDMDKLTITFADYRVPQLLRHYNVLIYSKPLAAKVDACQ